MITGLDTDSKIFLRSPLMLPSDLLLFLKKTAKVVPVAIDVLGGGY